jgi:DNA-binding NtrC family response regulator
MKPKTVLVVEDDLTIRRALTRMLRLAGWLVIPAADGTTGLELFESYPTSVIVTDIMMPDGLNGLQMMARIRGIDPQVPFVVLTAHATAETRDAALRAGAGACLQKPVEIGVLLDALDRALASRRD